MSILIRNLKSGEWNPVESKPFTDEEGLKKLLVESPQILPAEDLEVSFLVAIPEFGLGTGSTDILAFSADGDIAIIECKLSSNPDIKRRVIGQILEYASYLWRMSYEQVDGKVNEKQGKSLVELVRNKAGGEWNEENFRSGVKNSLEKGEFFLIIAVDEINDELKRIVQYVNECGNPAYSLHALEMRRFQTGDVEILIPHLFPESKEIPRPPPGPEEFFKDLQENQPESVARVVKELYDWATGEEMKRAGGRVEFGGKKYRSLKFYLQDISASIFSIYATSGSLVLNYGWLLRCVSEETIREFHKMHGLSVPDDFSKFPPIKIIDTFVDKPEVVKRFKESITWLANKGTT
jgi:hypothetical protein